ncbi:hypothetical protein [Oceaniglobus indicus]|uniref:hypothetical protein n=1 Tax=Oceaniglobus indicus TaxID=2047749 RepID=UPI000C1865EB|nr:hypothetical protein [Oceaniglobus indicus]
MPTPLRLEDFGGPAARVKSPAAMPDLDVASTAPAADALDAFDKGYMAGWDDANKAAEAAASESDVNMRQSLEDLGFTYHEARVHVMTALIPLLKGIVTKVLPKLLHDTLGHRIVQEVESMADSAADLPVDLMISPHDAPAIRPVVEDVKTLPLRLIEEQSIAPGQMFLRVGNTEREVDLTGVLDSIAESVASLDQMNKETLRHG